MPKGPVLLAEVLATVLNMTRMNPWNLRLSTEESQKLFVLSPIPLGARFLDATSPMLPNSYCSAGNGEMTECLIPSLKTTPFFVQERQSGLGEVSGLIWGSGASCAISKPH